MQWPEALALGILQGLTEFLPVSSTAHLRIIPHYLGWDDPGTAFSAVLQLGTLISVLFYFSNDIQRLLIATVKSLKYRNIRYSDESLMAWSIAAGTLPIAILGLSFKDFIETEARSMGVIGTSLIVLAIGLMIAERIGQKSIKMQDLSFWKIQWIGLCQALALIPGCSRSGSTIMGGLIVGLGRSDAARFSFLLGLPAISASGLLELISLINEGLGQQDTTNIFIGILAAAISGYCAIGFLLRFISRYGTDIFSIYRILIGLTVIYTTW